MWGQQNILLSWYVGIIKLLIYIQQTQSNMSVSLQLCFWPLHEWKSYAPFLLSSVLVFVSS